jgi:uncharacterized alpha-E superfamily protein
VDRAAALGVSFETYRTLYRDQILPIKVAELLILERRMPRSLAACLDQITIALGRITGQQDAPAKRLASELNARLTHAHIEEIFQERLHEYLEKVHRGFRRPRRAHPARLPRAA